MKNAAILFIGLGKYSLFYDRFYRSVEKNFLPGVDKHFFIFSDEEIKAFDDETFVKTESFDNARDIKLHKFHFIKSAWEQIKSHDAVFYFDADNIVRNKITVKDIFDHDKSLIGVVHPWASIRESGEKFESNPDSGAFIEQNDIGIRYHQSCFWGGKTDKVEGMVNECYKTLQKDIENGHKNEHGICDEVHVNRYFALNSRDLFSLDKDYANPAEAYQSERRLNRKAFGNNLLISHDNTNQTYKHSLGLLEEQAKIKNNFSFAGWAQVKDNHKATFEMVKMFKAVNPNAHIHMTNSGDEDFSNICEAFNCSINRDASIKGWTSGNHIVEYDIWEWLQNLKEVCSVWLNHYEWLVILEDDVESFAPPTEVPECVLAGPHGPSFSRDLYNVLQKKFPDKKVPKSYTGCGGSLLNIEAFLCAINQIDKETWDELCEVDDKLLKYADISLSFVLAYAGFPIGEWGEFCGWADPFKTNKAFAHGNKQYYGKEIEDEDLDYLDYVEYSQIFINTHAHSRKNLEEFHTEEKMVSVDYHSFFKHLINKNSTCIDVGCRDFIFTNEISKLCSRVIAVDPGIDIEPPKDKNVIFLNQALTTSDAASVYLVRHGRLSAYYTSLENVGKNCLEVPNVSLRNLMKIFKLESIDLIKLDCEGSEYPLLYWLSQNPVAKQISVSFHDNLERGPYLDSAVYYEEIFDKLKENYHIVKHVKSIWTSNRGNAATNYEDSLLVRK